LPESRNQVDRDVLRVRDSNNNATLATKNR